MSKQLENFKDNVVEIRDTRGKNAKIALYESMTDWEKKVMANIFGKVKLGVGIKSYDRFIKKTSSGAVVEMKNSEYSDLLDLLLALAARDITGDKACSEIIKFLNDIGDNETSEIIKGLIFKSIKIGLGPATFGEAYKAMFASHWSEKRRDKNEKEERKAFIQRKIDGTRCLMYFYPDGEVKILSRYDKIKPNFKTFLSELKYDLPEYLSDGLVLDGEFVAIVDGKEHYEQSKIMYNKKKEDYTEGFRINIFEMVGLKWMETIKEKKTKWDKQLYSKRISDIEKFVKSLNNDMIVMFDSLPYSEKKFEEEKVKMRKENWEGLIIRYDSVYEKRRSPYLLKYKTEMNKTAEYVVIDIIRSKQNMRDTNKREDVVSSLVFEHRGKKVKVGSGLSWTQKRTLTKESVVGKVITVEYKGESKDSDGTFSLREPILKTIHMGETRDT